MGQKVIGEIQVKMDKNLEKETTPGKTIKILSTFKKMEVGSKCEYLVDHIRNACLSTSGRHSSKKFPNLNFPPNQKPPFSKNQ